MTLQVVGSLVAQNPKPQYNKHIATHKQELEMKFAYQVIDEPVGKTYYIDADSREDAVAKICDQWEMLEDCIEMLEAV